MKAMEDSISWSWWRLADAEPLALFTYLRLRSDVFVVEQGCIYPDMDDHDLVAWHLTGADALGRLLAVRACSRRARSTRAVARPRDRHPGRRGTGAGHLLVDEALRKAAADIQVTATASKLRRT